MEKKALFLDDSENQRFSLEIPNMAPEEAWIKGEREANRLEEEACKALVERLKGVNSKIEKKEVSLLYTPVWIFNYRVDNIPYRNIVCCIRGKVIGEMPTNFEKLFEKLRNIQKEMAKLSTYFVIIIIGTILLLITLIGSALVPFTGIAIYLLYQKRNEMQKKFDKEFEALISTNKYNLCYYILRKRTDLISALNLGTIPGIDIVERCLDEEEGGKIDPVIVKELAARYLLATKPAGSETPAEKIEKFLGMKKDKTDPVIEKSKKPEAIQTSKTNCTCGQVIKEGWKICPICGNKIN